MLRVFIVDDEPLVLDNLELILGQFPDIQILHRSTDSAEALALALQQKPDAIFLDISMPGLSGLAFAEKLYESQASTKIIFVTAYDNFAVDAYAYNTVDYILKPVTYDKVSRMMRKLEKQQQSMESAPQEEHSFVSFMGFRNNRYYAIAPEQAQYIYVNNRKVFLVSDGEEYLLKSTINAWTEKLQPHGWLRCHRNYLINLSQVETVEPMSNSVYYVSMKKCSEKIIVSRLYSATFRSLFDM